MSQYKLTYFNVMGLGEPIRFLLSYGGDEFEDIRVMDRENEWPRIKPTTPFGQLPVLEIDGKPFSQTLPICRYLAKRLNLIGKTDLDSLEIDAVAAALHDLRKQVAMFYREEDPVLREKKREQTVKNVVPFYLDKLEERAKSNGGYFRGGELSYADIFFTAIHDSLANACSIDITEGRPHLRAIRDKVLNIPSIKKWVDKRPKLEF
ncbi:glutathione S-transferase [Diachasma alloeum]|uniref:glutathione S-transferase n=1 Tax=Diachasma alloeum TaxID=454923 RepID=UPI0007382490|nr:glutathione S-transferase [Diachasma alloeum]